MTDILTLFLDWIVTGGEGFGGTRVIGQSRTVKGRFSYDGF